MIPNKPLLKSWVAALKSGKYKQGSGALATQTLKGVHYCCLGVACEVAIRSGLTLTKGKIDNHISYNRDINLPPCEVVKLFGFFGFLAGYVSMNDRGILFKDIAKVIERDFDL